MENKRDIKQGTYNGEITYCPVNGWDCPYFEKGEGSRCGVCHIDDPIEDCEDFACAFGSWEDWESL